MKGIWVRSQDGNNLVFVRTFEVWQGGRIVARFGKDWKLLGDYNGQEQAKEILQGIEVFISKGVEEVFKMPNRIGEMI